MKIYTSSSPEMTLEIAESFSQELNGGEIIAFKGDLGMGKTCFTRGIAKGLGYKGEVNSPTFSVMNEYKGGRLDIFHFDMYRISSWEDLDAVGFFDYSSGSGVTVVEWSENIEGALNGEIITVNIERLDNTKRKISIERTFSE